MTPRSHSVASTPEMRIDTFLLKCQSVQVIKTLCHALEDIELALFIHMMTLFKSEEEVTCQGDTGVGLWLIVVLRLYLVTRFKNGCLQEVLGTSSKI